MSEESTVPSDAPPPEPVSPPSAPPARGSRLPAWLRYFSVAALAALISGGLVAIFVSSGGGKDSAPTVIEGFLHGSPSSSDNTFNAYRDKLPPNWPKDVSPYKGSRVIASFDVTSSDGTSYFAVLVTPDSAENVYNSYLQQLDQDPYQVEIARYDLNFIGLRYSSASNPDLSGDVTIQRSQLGNETSVFLSFQDSSSEARNQTPASKSFQPGPSRALPPGFPTEVPIYKGKAGPAEVIETYVERASSGRSFIITFVTKDSQDDVIAFYRDALGKLGWSLSDASDRNRGFTLSLNFDDKGKKNISGSVTADSFERDDSYTKVDLSVDIGSGKKN